MENRGSCIPSIINGLEQKTEQKIQYIGQINLNNGGASSQEGKITQDYNGKRCTSAFQKKSAPMEIIAVNDNGEVEKPDGTLVPLRQGGVYCLTSCTFHIGDGIKALKQGGVTREFLLVTDSGVVRNLPDISLQTLQEQAQKPALKEVPGAIATQPQPVQMLLAAIVN